MIGDSIKSLREVANAIKGYKDALTPSEKRAVRAALINISQSIEHLKFILKWRK